MIRSKLEYGSQIYGNAAQTHRNKLETSLNSYVRVSMRYIRSTPINVMLADSGLMPMSNRVEWLALKDIIKTLNGKNSNKKFLEKAITEKKSNGTYSTQLTVEHQAVLEQLVTKSEEQEGTPWKSKKDTVFDNVSGVNDKKSDVNQLIWQNLVTELMNTRYSKAKKIVTDAAKNKTGTAIAALDTGDGTHVTQKINPNTSITNAELIAIKEAIKLCITKNYTETVIVTDSRSACKMLKSKTHMQSNNVVKEISNMLDRCTDKGQRIYIQWVPSHVGIRWNEKVDQLTVKAAEGPITNLNKLTMDDTIKLAERTIWNKWRTNYKLQSPHSYG